MRKQLSVRSNNNYRCAQVSTEVWSRVYLWQFYCHSAENGIQLMAQRGWWWWRTSFVFLLLSFFHFSFAEMKSAAFLQGWFHRRCAHAELGQGGCCWGCWGRQPVALQLSQGKCSLLPPLHTDGWTSSTCCLGWKKKVELRGAGCQQNTDKLILFLSRKELYDDTMRCVDAFFIHPRFE